MEKLFPNILRLTLESRGETRKFRRSRREADAKIISNNRSENMV